MTKKEHKTILGKVEEEKFNLSCLFGSLATGKAITKTRRGWLVVFRPSPREPLHFDLGKVAIFDRSVQGDDTMRFYGGAYEVRAEVKRLCENLQGCESHTRIADLDDFLATLALAITRGDIPLP